MKTNIITTVVLLSLVSLSRAGEPGFLESKKSIPTRVEPGAPLGEFLPHSVWHAASKKDSWRSLTFTTDGRMHFSVVSGGGMLPYRLVDENSLLCQFSAGKTVRAIISKDRQTMTIEGRNYRLEPKLLTKFSSLVRKEGNESPQSTQ